MPGVTADMPRSLCSLDLFKENDGVANTQGGTHVCPCRKVKVMFVLAIGGGFLNVLSFLKHTLTLLSTHF